MGLSSGADAIAAGKPCFGILRCQVVEDRAALCQRLAVILLKRWYGPGGVDRETVF